MSRLWDLDRSQLPARFPMPALAACLGGLSYEPSESGKIWRNQVVPPLFPFYPHRFQDISRQILGNDSISTHFPALCPLSCPHSWHGLAMTSYLSARLCQEGILEERKLCRRSSLILSWQAVRLLCLQQSMRATVLHAIQDLGCPSSKVKANNFRPASILRGF